MTDWTPKVEPFSREVAELYAREMARKLVRCKLNPAARHSEVRDFVKIAIEVYRKQKGN